MLPAILVGLFVFVALASREAAASPSTGLLAYWEANGLMTDSIGGNHGAPVNGAGFGAGKYGSGFALNGANQAVNVGSAINIANSSFTVAAWAKRTSPGTYDLILSQGSVPNTNTGLHFGFRDSVSNKQFTCAFYNNDLESPGGQTDSD